MHELNSTICINTLMSIPSAEIDSSGNFFMKTCTGDSNTEKCFSSDSNDIFMF